MFNQKKSKLMQTKGQLMKSLNTAFSFAPPSILSLTIFSGSFRYFAPLIIKAIETGDTSLISISAKFDDAIYNLKVLDGIRQSANKGEAVVLGKETNMYV